MMIRINRVATLTSNILEYNNEDVKKVIYGFLLDVSEINILKLGTSVGNDLIAERLFNENQDTIMKFLVTIINILVEDDEFFTYKNSYINSIHSITDIVGIFGEDYVKLMPTVSDKIVVFNELLALYIMGAVPTKVSIFGGE